MMTAIYITLMLLRLGGFVDEKKKLLHYVGGERSDSFDLSSVWENSTKSHIKSDKSALYFSQPSRE